MCALKVTRKIKRTLVKTQVNHAVAERLALSKFGKAKLDNNATATTVGENVKIRLNPGNKVISIPLFLDCIFGSITNLNSQALKKRMMRPRRRFVKPWAKSQ